MKRKTLILAAAAALAALAACEVPPEPTEGGDFEASCLGSARDCLELQEQDDVLVLGQK